MRRIPIPTTTLDVKTKKRKAKASTLTPEMAMREKDVVVNKRIKSMGEEEEMDAMRHVMLPRKKRELYRAMQLGLAKKEAESRRAAEAQGGAQGGGRVRKRERRDRGEETGGEEEEVSRLKRHLVHARIVRFEYGRAPRRPFDAIHCRLRVRSTLSSVS
jgi:hypothetical protein